MKYPFDTLITSAGSKEIPGNPDHAGALALVGTKGASPALVELGHTFQRLPSGSSRLLRTDGSHPGPSAEDQQHEHVIGAS